MNTTNAHSNTPFRDRSLFGLVLVIVFLLTVLLLINYFTIKITSGVRASISGSFFYTKGQKDATLNLLLYLQTGDPRYWKKFNNELRVPIADSIARIELRHDGNDEIIENRFLEGHNNKDDIPELIWLFKNFKNFLFVKMANSIWTESDRLIGRELELGNTIYRKVQSGTLTNEERKVLVAEIDALNEKLSRIETNFSEHLNSTSRSLYKYLFYANICLGILIFGGASRYILVMINRLKERNRDLSNTNKELDQFVYSVSHDLRAPITSMKGLIQVASLENNPDKIKTFFNYMNGTLNQQDVFIKEIINFSRNKRSHVDIKVIDLSELIDQILERHRYIPESNEVSIEKNLLVTKVLCDPVRLEIVLNNLISNAIKFIDKSKTEKTIRIRSWVHKENYLIEIQDNGIGIDKNDLDHIFNMFFVTQHDNKGSGLGLYVTKETINKLNGQITAESEKGVGTKFTIRIPKQ